MTTRYACMCAVLVVLGWSQAAAQNSDLLGSWESSGEFGTVSLVFHTENLLEFDGDTYNYEAGTDVIRIAEGYEIAEYPYRLAGGTLTIAFPDGSQLQFSRKGARSDAPAPTGESPQRSEPGSAGLMAHFAGVWVNSTTNTQTKNYLAADGRYYQNYESAYSGSSNDQYGNETNSWGSAGQQTESGRWSVQGTREAGVLTITYPDGSTAQVNYRVHVERGYTYWNEYFFDGVLYGKQKE